MSRISVFSLRGGVRERNVQDMAKKATSKQAPRERLMRRAEDLFYKKGFSNTGVRDVIKGARTVPATFYDHFPSKGDLGLAYLKVKADLLTRNLRTIIARHKSVRKVLHAWADFKRGQIEARKFLGCPVAGFAYQSGELSPAFQKEVGATADHWHALLREFFQDAVSAGELKPRTDCDELARTVLMIYEGALAMWKLTRDIRYIDDMEKSMLAAYESRRA